MISKIESSLLYYAIVISLIYFFSIKLIYFIEKKLIFLRRFFSFKKINIF
ncbi:hypothetical protein DSUL_50097 [Desulfovibrionales bacterium]